MTPYLLLSPLPPLSFSSSIFLMGLATYSTECCGFGFIRVCGSWILSRTLSIRDPQYCCFSPFLFPLATLCKSFHFQIYAHFSYFFIYFKLLFLSFPLIGTPDKLLVQKFHFGSPIFSYFFIFIFFTFSPS
jgi:hypothetical protein